MFAHPLRHTLAAMSLLAAVGLASLCPVSSAHAMLGTCRTDPVLTLSNGVTLRIVDDIGADISTIKSITHFVHLPVGVSILSVVYDDNVSYKEGLSVSNDQLAGSYSSASIVGLSAKGIVAVTTTATAWTTADATHPIVTTSASGTAPAAISVALTY